jgi:hypothetical protein
LLKKQGNPLRLGKAGVVSFAFDFIMLFRGTIYLVFMQQQSFGIGGKPMRFWGKRGLLQYKKQLLVESWLSC